MSRVAGNRPDVAPFRNQLAPGSGDMLTNMKGHCDLCVTAPVPLWGGRETFSRHLPRKLMMR